LLAVAVLVIYVAEAEALEDIFTALMFPMQQGLPLQLPLEQVVPQVPTMLASVYTQRVELILLLEAPT
jgi:hypothetical protein